MLMTMGPKLPVGSGCNLVKCAICEQRGPSEFAKEVYHFVAQIPPGQVSTYKAVASALKRPGAARAVGSALKVSPTTHLCLGDHQKISFETVSNYSSHTTDVHT